jgi:RND family efflux transporter MFP subunit
MTNKTFPIVWLWLWRIIKVAAVVAIIGGIIYWVRFQPVAVIAHEVSRGPIVSEVMGTGTLEARIKATISPKISGRIEEVLVDQTDRVTTGQLLVRLDDSELTQQVAIAQADVETKQAAIKRLETDISRAAAVLNQAETNYKRLEDLRRQNAISQDELDKAAEGQAIAESESSRADAALAEGRKALVVAERSLEFQKTKLTDSKIRAPFDGLIVRRIRDPGDVVVPGSAILSLISTEQLWINAWVDETEMARLKTGQTAKVIFRSESGTTLPAKLIRLGKETDRETREFVVDVEILKLPENWAVGQRAEVFVETARKTDVVLIPNNFINRKGEQTGVFVNRNGVVAWQTVELGLRSRDSVEIVNGIDAGETIILPRMPQRPLRSGQRIANP